MESVSLFVFTWRQTFPLISTTDLKVEIVSPSAAVRDAYEQKRFRSVVHRSSAYCTAGKQTAAFKQQLDDCLCLAQHLN